MGEDEVDAPMNGGKRCSKVVRDDVQQRLSQNILAFLRMKMSGLKCDDEPHHSKNPKAPEIELVVYAKAIKRRNIEKIKRDNAEQSDKRSGFWVAIDGDDDDGNDVDECDVDDV